MEHMNNVGLFP